MSTITLQIPDNALASLGSTPEKATAELRLAVGMKLYELKKLSSGAAAELAGIPKVLFMTRLAEFGILAFRLTGDDLDQEKPLA